MALGQFKSYQIAFSFKSKLVLACYLWSSALTLFRFIILQQLIQHNAFGPFQ
jgi:hypothetical protein